MTSTINAPTNSSMGFPYHENAGAEPAATAELLARVRAGDECAREALVREHTGRMLAAARRILRSEDDCADAVQDAFLAGFRFLEDFEGNSTLGTWLHRIVVNVCLMKLRARVRQREVQMDDRLPIGDGSGHPSRPPGRSEEQAPAQLTRAETRAQVRACIDRLPPYHREILLLRDIAELDTEQTARLLGIRPGTVKTRLHRARRALRILLEPLHGRFAISNLL